MPHTPRRPTALHTTVRSALMVLLSATLASALAQNITDVPVAVKNNVAPNFMFMIDNSGSMSNIVPTSPYDPTATYQASCPSGQTIPSGNASGDSVDISVSNGAPRFVYNGNTYIHITVSGSSQRCFNNAGTYFAKLLGDSNGSPSNYLPTTYTGHYLNWYFGAFGGPTTGWGSRKPLTSGTVQTRMEIAKDSATSVVEGLPLPVGAGAAPVRVGLSTYNSGKGGALRVRMGDLTSTTLGTLKTSISTLAPSGNTPLASTLADIGRYLSTGYNGNITAGSVSGVSIDDFLRQNGDDASSRRS
ncbi:MAG: hypothetical protein EOO23_06350, partial [Comamonadaceae bacterium]